MRHHSIYSLTLASFLASLLLVAFIPQPALAQTWSGGAGNTHTSWGNAANWTGGVPGSGAAVVFGATEDGISTTIDGSYSINSVTFTSSLPYELELNTTGSLTLNGSGLTNQSTYQAEVINYTSAGSTGSTTFNNSASGGNIQFINYGTGTGGLVTFNSTSNAGTGSILNESGASAGRAIFNGSSSAGSVQIDNDEADTSGQAGGYTTFNGSSTAGTAYIINLGGSVSGAGGGHTDFYNSASAGTSTIQNTPTSGQGNAAYTNFNDTTTAASSTIYNSGTLTFHNSSTAAESTIYSDSGTVYFNDSSSGGTARLAGTAGTFDISNSASGISVGSIEGAASYYLGGKNLAFGSLNTNTTVTGNITDGGLGGSLTKNGTGTTILAGTNSYTGGTTVGGGRLGVDGSVAGNVSVSSGAELGGHGSVTGSIGGAGSVGPGDSNAGILTASSTNPSAGLTYNFELNQAGAPSWSNASASGNDVLHLTSGSAFSSALTAANQINIYVSQPLTADGGFFINGGTDTLSLNLTNATYTYYSLDNANGIYTYDGNKYDKYTGLTSESTVQVTSANFTSGTVSGYTQQFQIGAPTVTPTSSSTSVSSGTSFTTVAPVTTVGGLGTQVTLLAGTASSNKTVVLSTTTQGGNFFGLASDVVSVSGNDGDLFALQLTFNPTAAAGVGGVSKMSILWLNPTTGQWVTASAGDHGTNDASGLQLGYMGSFASFQEVYGTNLSLYLGAYGTDTTNDTTWAVIDHNSDFGTGNTEDTPVEAAPEPSTLLLGGLGLGLLAFLQFRRRTAAVL